MACVCCGCSQCVQPCRYQMKSGSYAVVGPYGTLSGNSRGATTTVGDFVYTSILENSINSQRRFEFSRSRTIRPVTSIATDSCPELIAFHGRTGTGAQQNVSHLVERSGFSCLIRCDATQKKLFLDASWNDSLQGAGLSYGLPITGSMECWGRAGDLQPGFCGIHINGIFYQQQTVLRRKTISSVEIPSECVSGETTFPGAACVVDVSLDDGVTVTAGGSSFAQSWQSVVYEGILTIKTYSGPCYNFDWNGAQVVSGSAIESMITPSTAGTWTIQKMNEESCNYY